VSSVLSVSLCPISGRHHLEGMLNSGDGAVDICELAVVRKLLNSHKDTEMLLFLEDVAVDRAPWWLGIEGLGIRR
jgi:hypothetical protein